MTRGIVLGIVAVLLLAGTYWVALQAAVRTKEASDNGDIAAEFREPEILLSGVNVREIRNDGRTDRVLARRASYRLLSGNLLAEQVQFTVEDGNGSVEVEAPRMFWDMQAGRVDLPQGGSARNGSGWSARLPDARIDLPGRMLTATRATLTLPGIRVDGSELVWRWKNGTVELASPQSRLLPDPLRRGIGEGREP